MKGSSAAFGLKSLAARLHPQVPLDSKDSHRLLNHITRSFRQQLDKAHPPIEHRSAAPPKSDSTTRKSAEPPSSVVSADRHVAAVLTNSLLTSTIISEDVRGRSTAARRPGLLPQSLEDAFAAQPNRDRLSIARQYLQQATQPFPELLLNQRRDLLRELQPGKQVLAWLRTQVFDMLLNFAKEQRQPTLNFIRNLAETLWLEGNQRLILDWIKQDAADLARDSRLLATYLNSPDAHFSRILLANLVQADKLSLLDASVALAPYHTFLPGFCPSVLSYAATVQMKHLREELYGHEQERQAHIYDSCLKWAYMWWRSPFTVETMETWLRLHHPKTPSTQSALDFLRLYLDPERSATLGSGSASKQSGLPSPTKIAPGKLGVKLEFLRDCLRDCMGTTAARLSREDGNSTDALWLMSEIESYNARAGELDQIRVRVAEPDALPAQQSSPEGRMKPKPKPQQQEDDLELLAGFRRPDSVWGLV